MPIVILVKVHYVFIGHNRQRLNYLNKFYIHLYCDLIYYRFQYIIPLRHHLSTVLLVMGSTHSLIILFNFYEFLLLPTVIYYTSYNYHPIWAWGHLASPYSIFIYLFIYFHHFEYKSHFTNEILTHRLKAHF